MNPLATIYTLLAIFAITSRSTTHFTSAQSVPVEDNEPVIVTSTAESDADTCTVSNGEGECLPAPLSSVYVIGDLHGDVLCALTWVNRTGLIENLFDSSLVSDHSLPLQQRLNPSTEWKWTNPHSTLVFMGDYVDKGPTSKQTVQFVRDLTLTFPEQVTALLGNHEMELLRDRDARIAPERRYSSFAHASVHPGEYHNYFEEKESTDNDVKSDSSTVINKDGDDENVYKAKTRSLDKNDDLVLNLLYAASMEVYGHNAHNSVRIVPHSNHQSVHAITEIIPEEHRKLAAERLEEYQKHYFDAYRSGSVLGSWLESRPVIHFAKEVGTLFVHGGVPSSIGKLHLNKGKESTDKLNSVWREHSTDDKLADFLWHSNMGHVVEELLTYRGNHPGYSSWESHGHYEEDSDDDETCAALNEMLAKMPGINRIAVGHTPDFNVRFYCNKQFLALDSMLGRGIRTTGNEYCPWPGHDMQGGSKTSQNGRYRCQDVPETCNGETVRLDSDGSVHVMTL